MKVLLIVYLVLTGNTYFIYTEQGYCESVAAQIKEFLLLENNEPYNLIIKHKCIRISGNRDNN